MIFGIWETEPTGATGSRSGLVRLKDGEIRTFKTREAAEVVANWLTATRALQDGYKTWRAVELREEEG